MRQLLRNKEASFLVIILLFGIILRIIWNGDMEWKFDQMHVFNESQKISINHELPSIGMISGQGLVNPALGIWVYGIFGFFSKTPLGINRIVQFINIFSILFFITMIYLNKNRLEKKDQQILLGGILLASISPMPIMMSKVIWQQSLLPIFCVFFFWSHFLRSSKFGSLIWGLLGALLGQIHMSGFFLAFSIVLFTFFRDLKLKKIIHFKEWLIGSILGSIPLIPWVLYISNNFKSQPADFPSMKRFYFWRHIFKDFSGLHTKYKLAGLHSDFLNWPFNTHATGLIWYLLYGLGTLAVFLGFKKIIKKIKQNELNPMLFSELDYYIFSILIGFGIILTISGRTIHPHYIMIIFPFSHIILARILYPRLIFLKIFIILHLIISTSYLSFIHHKSNLYGSEYGNKFIQEKKPSSDF